jgi:hypothetical protein
MVNPAKWFGTRELKTVPPHFIKAQTPLTPNAKFWVTSKLEGRFAVVEVSTDDDFLSSECIFFENPTEAMMYELRWSGSK